MNILDYIKAVLNPSRGSTEEVDSLNSNTQYSSMGVNNKIDSTAQLLTAMQTDEVPIYTYHIGDLAEKYETGMKGPGVVSTDPGDPGGTSYGSYQIETNKGTMKAYLTIKDKYTNQLSKFVINSQGFQDKWKQLAEQDPDGFQQSQFNFICMHSYNAAIEDAKNRGWPTNTFALQSAIFSTSNQSGGWKIGIHDKTGIKFGDDIITIINKYYDARANYFKSLSLPNDIKKAIIQNRTVDERKDCIALIGK